MPVADLVLEGGGVKGIGLVGAISVLEEHGYTFHRVAGTSAGAIVGSLVAAGVGADQLQELMQEISYPQLQDPSPLDRLGLPGKVANIVLKLGVYRGRYLEEWLGRQLAQAGVHNFDDLRLEDPGLSAPPAQQAYKLVVMTSDVSEGRLVRLPWDYGSYGLAPGAQSVVGAVRQSMSIPFFYQAVRMAGSWFVDGGMLSNFPVDAFDRQDDQPPRWPTFGIKLSARPEAKQVDNHVKGVVSLARAMIATMTSFYDQMHLANPAVLARTIFVDTAKVKATDFGIDPATQELLYQNGRSAATQFLQRWDFGSYVERFRSGGPAV